MAIREPGEPGDTLENNLPKIFSSRSVRAARPTPTDGMFTEPLVSKEKSPSVRNSAQTAFVGE